MITISSSPKSQRIQQINDANVLLDTLQNNSKTDDIAELITKFKSEYSEIALERVINYHLDNCIQSFLANSTYKYPCVIHDYKNIIEEFATNFPLFKTSLYKKKLIDSIQWNTSQLNVSNIHLMDPLLAENCKEAIQNAIELELTEIIESVGICTFDQLRLNEAILLIQNRFDFDFEALLLNKYIQYM